MCRVIFELMFYYLPNSMHCNVWAFWCTWTLEHTHGHSHSNVTEQVRTIFSEDAYWKKDDCFYSAEVRITFHFKHEFKPACTHKHEFSNTSCTIFPACLFHTRRRVEGLAFSMAATSTGRSVSGTSAGVVRGGMDGGSGMFGRGMHTQTQRTAEREAQRVLSGYGKRFMSLQVFVCACVCKDSEEMILWGKTAEVEYTDRLGERFG